MVRSIDIHAHMVPQAVWIAAQHGDDWFGALAKNVAFEDYLMIGALREGAGLPKTQWDVDQRVRYMDETGTDVQVLSVAPALMNYELPPEDTSESARQVNDEIASMVGSRPDRLLGLATLPLPDVQASVEELERAVGELGLKGAQLDTRVNLRHWDDPAFEPLFAAAEELSATLFFHPSRSFVWNHLDRYHLGNTVGNPAEDMLAVAVLILGGVIERHPALKAVIAHGGGPTCFGIGHLDRAWEVDPEVRAVVRDRPSSYMRRLYFDCITFTADALRILIDVVGADRVVLGSDWPYRSGPASPANWLMSLDNVSEEEKALIMHKNVEYLLDLPPEIDR